MSNEIKDKYSSAAAMTITLASLASSTVNLGRQSTMIDNSVTRYSRIRVYVKIKQGTSPTGNKAVYISALRGDQHGTPIRTDNAGPSDAALTVFNAPIIGTLRNASSPATGDVLAGECLIVDPGPEWGIHISHDIAAALDATGSNHAIHWIGENPEVQ